MVTSNGDRQPGADVGRESARIAEMCVEHTSRDASMGRRRIEPRSREPKAEPREMANKRRDLGLEAGGGLADVVYTDKKSEQPTSST